MLLAIFSYEMHRISISQLRNSCIFSQLQFLLHILLSLLLPCYPPLIILSFVSGVISPSLISYFSIISEESDSIGSSPFLIYSIIFSFFMFLLSLLLRRYTDGPAYLTDFIEKLIRKRQIKFKVFRGRFIHLSFPLQILTVCWP